MYISVHVQMRRKKSRRGEKREIIGFLPSDQSYHWMMMPLSTTIKKRSSVFQTIVHDSIPKKLWMIPMIINISLLTLPMTRNKCKEKKNLLPIYVFWKTRKSQFLCNYWNPQFFLLLLLPSGWSFARGWPLIWQPRQGHEQCIFETLHNEIKFGVSKNQISMKKDQNLHICLRSGWL